MEQHLDSRLIDEFLVKKPFTRVMPNYYGGINGIFSDGSAEAVPVDNVVGKTMSQADFLREYYVSGHKINSPDYYPDVWKKDENGKAVVELVSRTAFPFQQVIATKQTIHLTGNQIRIEDSTINPSAESKKTLLEFKQGWKDKNMEIAFFNAVHSAKTTGDAALCFFYDRNNKLRWKGFSYHEGDTLYMHYDQETGDNKLFIRKFSMFDDKDKEVREYLEAWDKTYMYRFTKEKSGYKGVINSIKDRIGASGWKLISSSPHGFERLPVCYYRDNDVCWSESQNSIEMYEMAVSQLCENNKAYAFPILFVKGGDLNFKGQVNGRPYAILSSDENSDAKTINRAEASQAFDLQLKILLQNIFMGSFSVLPPELKSGDIPGVAVKLLYSPAVEKAIQDSKRWDGFIDGMIKLFKEGFGKESSQTSRFNMINVHGSIEPYVHQNTAEVMQNLFSGVTAGYLSKESAAESNPYSKNDEYNRLLNQTRNEIIGLQNETENEQSTVTKDAKSGEARSTASSK